MEVRGLDSSCLCQGQIAGCYEHGNGQITQQNQNFALWNHINYVFKQSEIFLRTNYLQRRHEKKKVGFYKNWKISRLAEEMLVSNHEISPAELVHKVTVFCLSNSQLIFAPQSVSYLVIHLVSYLVCLFVCYFVCSLCQLHK